MYIRSKWSYTFWIYLNTEIYLNILNQHIELVKRQWSESIANWLLNKYFPPTASRSFTLAGAMRRATIEGRNPIDKAFLPLATLRQTTAVFLFQISNMLIESLEES